MKHTLIPASYLILKQGNKILLSRRENTGYEDGNYSLVSGHVNTGETFTQAIIREAYEEAGIILTYEDVKIVHMVHRKGTQAERVDAFFVATNWKGIIENREPHKCSDIGWFPIDDLPENTVSKIKIALDDVENGKIYSEHGWN